MRATDNSKPPHPKGLVKYTWWIVVFWTLVLAFLLARDLAVLDQAKKNLAIREARTHLQKDEAFRFWAATHGGFYVPVDARTPPNPFLDHIAERDIITPSGVQLTLMNPAYALRQMNEEFAETYGADGHLTSLLPLRPENAPDDWERRALKAFETGEVEVIEFTQYQGSPSVRLMRPLITQEGCLKCHEQQGYVVGDVRGGVSVSVPLAPYLAEEQRSANGSKLSYALVWLSGSVLIIEASRIVNKNIFENAESREMLRESYKQLEIRVQERTAELNQTNRELQAEITARTQALEEINKLSKFPAQNPNPVLSIATDGTVIYHNTASAPLLKHWNYVNGEPLPDLWFQLVQDALGDVEVKTGEIEIDDKVLSLTFAPIVEGRFVNVYGLDITELKRATEALWEYSERLEEMVEVRTRDLEAIQEQLIRQERLAVLGALAGGVGHELRNPLGVITNAIYFLKLVLPDADVETREYLSLIDKEVNKAAKIVSDLLDFTRTKSGDCQQTGVRALIEESLVRNRAPEGISVDMVIPNDLPPVWVDPQQIALVLNNLIVNAYQAMPEGGKVTINCEPYAESSGESLDGLPETTRGVRVSVCDTGTGIPPEHGEAI